MTQKLEREGFNTLSISERTDYLQASKEQITVEKVRDGIINKCFYQSDTMFSFRRKQLIMCNG